MSNPLTQGLNLRSRSLLIIAITLMLSVASFSGLVDGRDFTGPSLENDISHTASDTLMDLGDGSDEKLIIYYFYGEGCPHCAITTPFINEMAEKYPETNFIKLDVYFNASNRALFNDFLADFNETLCDISGCLVPTIIIENELCLRGEDDIKAQLEDEIIRLIVEMNTDPPGAPQDLAPLAGDSYVSLTWTAPLDDGGATVTGYNVYRGTFPNGEALIAELGNVLTFNDTGRTNGVTYYYVVSAENYKGEGPKSVEVSATPLGVSSAPTLTSAVPGNSHVNLTWMAPAVNGGTSVIGYNLYRGTASGGETLFITLGDVLNYNDTGLSNGVTYYYQVRAVNSIGESARSNELSAMPDVVPSAPTLIYTTASDGMVVVAWSEPIYDSVLPIIGYNVYRGTEPGDESLLTSVGAILQYEDFEVTNGVTYFYRVSAMNSIGEGPLSNELGAKPLGLPGAPRNIQATPGNTSINLTWLAPIIDGGSVITNYQVWRGSGSGAETFYTNVGPQLWFNDTGLVNGVTYYYFIKAVNDQGVGPSSVEAMAAASSEIIAPSAPYALIAASGNTKVDLSWSPPTNNGGAAIIGYAIYRGTAPGELSLLIMLGNDLSYSDIHLTNGVTYYYQVSAVSSEGEGGLSEEVSVTPATWPGTPVIRSAISGDGQVVLTWSAPGNNGGATISGYRLYRGTTSGSETLLIALGDVLTYTDDNLTNGVTYYYRVSAVNSAGEGLLSTRVSSMPAGVPTAPTITSIVHGDGEIVISWTAPADDGGASITTYAVYRGEGPSNMSLVKTLGNVLTYTDTGLTNGVTYYYQITAVNSKGEGARSTEASATPVGSPTIPTLTSAEPGDGFVTVKWTAPSYSGPGTLTYHLFRDGVEVWNGTDTDHIDLGLTNGVAYSYSVAASNSIGWGQNSTSLQATPIKTVENSDDLTIGAVIVAAIIDSINPCAISVMIFLLIFLTSLGDKKRVLLVGIAYIVTVYLVYFIAGLGLLTFLQSTSMTRYVYYVAAILSIALGVLNIKEFVLPSKKPIVAISESKKPIIKRYIEKASIPGAIVLGIMVSLFELPCTGGVYLAILSLLGNEMTLTEGIPWLILYNIIFVLPLVIVLVVIYKGVSAEKANSWRIENRRWLRLLIGLVMLGLGALMLLNVF